MVCRNERRTEDLVRDHFRKDAYPRLTSEEQKSADPRITKCLAAASKQGSGIGKPEFLLHSPDAPGFVVVIECKADPAKHVSRNVDLAAPETREARDFAVDGAVHYAKHLSNAFDVITIGVSGETPSTMRVSTFRRLKGATTSEEFHSCLLVDAPSVVKLAGVSRQEDNRCPAEARLWRHGRRGQVRLRHRVRGRSKNQ